MKQLFLILPLMLFGNFYEKLPNRRFIIKSGPASTIYHKTRLRPSLSLGVRTQKERRFFDAFDVSCSYSYNNINEEMRDFSIGELFMPKLLFLHHTSKASENSFFFGIGTGLYYSFLEEQHANSSYLLSSGDDNIYRIHSFSYFGPSAIASFGYDISRFKEISSGFQVDVNAPLPLFSLFKKGTAPYISVEISYILGF